MKWNASTKETWEERNRDRQRLSICMFFLQTSICVQFVHGMLDCHVPSDHTFHDHREKVPGLLAGDLVLDNDVFDPSEPRWFCCNGCVESPGSWWKNVKTIKRCLLLSDANDATRIDTIDRVGLSWTFGLYLKTWFFNCSVFLFCFCFVSSYDILAGLILFACWPDVQGCASNWLRNWAASPALNRWKASQEVRQ